MDKIRMVKPGAGTVGTRVSANKWADAYLKSDTTKIDIDEMVKKWERGEHLKIVDGIYTEIEFSEYLLEKLK